MVLTAFDFFDHSILLEVLEIAIWYYGICSSLDCKPLSKSFAFSASWYHLLKVLQHPFWCLSRIHTWSHFSYPQHLLYCSHCF